MKKSRLVYGWQQIPSPVITEIIVDIFDGVVIDTEHAMWNNETLAHSIQVATLMNKKCLVRLHKRSILLISRVLDLGASGVILSTVETFSEAQQFIKESLHPCHGGHRGTGLVRENMWGSKTLQGSFPILIPQIETKKGIENIKQIANDAFSYYLIGPYDLSASLGCLGDFGAFEFTAAISEFEAHIPLLKRAIHIPKDILENFMKFSSFDMVCAGMDTIALIEKSKEDVSFAKNFCTNSD